MEVGKEGRQMGDRSLSRWEGGREAGSREGGREAVGGYSARK